MGPRWPSPGAVRCPVTAGPEAPRGEDTRLGAHLCQGTKASTSLPVPTPLQEGVAACTTQALQQTLGQPARPCVVGPSWTGRLPPRWRPGGRPAAPSAQASAVFLGIESPPWPAGPSISRGVTPPCSAPARCPCQGSLGTHTQSRGTCAHTHAHSLSHTPFIRALSPLSR